MKILITLFVIFYSHNVASNSLSSPYCITMINSAGIIAMNKIVEIPKIEVERQADQHYKHTIIRSSIQDLINFVYDNNIQFDKQSLQSFIYKTQQYCNSLTAS